MFMRNELCGAGRTRNRIYSDIDGCGRSKTRSKIVQVAGKTKPGVYFTRLSGHKGRVSGVRHLIFFRSGDALPRVFPNGRNAFSTGMQHPFVCGRFHGPGSGGASVAGAERKTVRTGGMRDLYYEL